MTGNKLFSARKGVWGMTMGKLRAMLHYGPVKHILDTLEEGVIIVDRECRIVFYNKTLARLEGLEQEEVMGRSLFEVFPSITPQASTMYTVMETGVAIHERHQQYFNFRGREIKTINSTVPIFDGTEAVGALEVSRDISLIISLTEKLAVLEQKTGTKGKTAKQNSPRFIFDDIIGSSRVLFQIKDLLRKVSRTTSTVFIYGETGTGKELFAQSIHNEGQRRNKQFVAQNCAALPETLLEGILFGVTKGSFTGATDKIGLFEQANGGTVFLDEINSMSLALQAKLLRVLQEGTIRRLGGNEDIPIDVRFIAATNEKPVDLVKSGKLREDLFYRLSVICVEIPPLRERPDDIEELIRYFIAKYNRRFGKKIAGVSSQVSEIFLTYRWPGNVRELEHTIEALLNFADEGEIQVEHLHYLSFGAFRSFVGRQMVAVPPEEMPLTLKNECGEYERKRILELLTSVEGNISEAARLMGIKRQSLQYRLKKYRIAKKDWRDGREI
jgi:arginine utilization regulatory protein